MEGVGARLYLNQDDFKIVHSEDVEPILEANKRDFNSGHDGYSPSRELRHAARIPAVVYYIWLNTYGIDALNKDHAEGVRRLLNSNEWRYLRTSNGRLG